ncbi:MAG: SPASM domain-containing protein, partial [Candidatus Omnitrophica bacterium]|nr:SPASM domain-containing protein [Candidatus Omnitrophota bacterium]
INSGLDHLQISVQATSEKAYRSIDLKTDFADLLSNIDRFLFINNGKINVYISIIALEAEIAEWRSFVKVWRKKGAKVRFKPFTDWNSESRAIREFGISSVRGRNEVYPCDWLWQQLHVLWDGRVVPCCFDYDGLQVLGDLNKDTVAGIWNNSAFQQMRKLHLTGGLMEAPCAKCNRRRKPWYEIPFHVLIEASLIYRMRFFLERKPSRRSQ